MEKIKRILVVTGVGAQPGGSVLVHTSQEGDDTWGGYTFQVRQEEQPRIGQQLVITIEEEWS